MADVVAEGLAQHNRHGLVRALHRRGLTDIQIAEHTAMTTYTSARIRASLGLAPNGQKGGPADEQRSAPVGTVAADRVGDGEGSPARAR